MKPKQLWKTSITIWTDYNPGHMELDDLARQATVGDAYCDRQEVEEVTDSAKFPATDFFGDDSD